MRLLHDSIAICNYFLVFIVAGVGYFEALPKKMACCQQKSIWIDDPYGSYGLIRMTHTDYQSV